MKNEVKKCCICGDYFDGWGNNPWPVKKRGECCSYCNSFVVIPARIELDMREYYKRMGAQRKECANV